MNATCPIDEKPLSLTQSDRLDVMSCEACKGAWLPASSAGALLSRLQATTPPQQKFFDKVKAEGHPSSLECLECGTELLTVEHRAVDIDVCPDCGGIWFDGGELQRFRTAAIPAPANLVTPAKAGAVVAGAAVLGAVGVAGAAAVQAAQPSSPIATAASGIGDVAVDGVMEVVGEVAGSVFSAILESIFD